MPFVKYIALALITSMLNYMLLSPMDNCMLVFNLALWQYLGLNVLMLIKIVLINIKSNCCCIYKRLLFGYSAYV